MNKTRLILGVSVVAALATVARGAEFSDDFESYAAGSNLHGQNGWKGWDNDPGAAALVSIARAASGTKSVAVAGASDLVREFSGVTSGQWQLSMKQYIPSSLTTGTTYLIALDKYRDGGASNFDEWSLQNSINLATGVITSDINGATTPVIRNAWVDWTFTIDLTANRLDQYYNNQFFTSHAWDTDSAADGLAAIDLFANGAGAVYYDDVSVQQVPEPTALVLLGLGGLAMGMRRRVR